MAKADGGGPLLPKANAPDFGMPVIVGTLFRFGVFIVCPSSVTSSQVAGEAGSASPPVH